MSVKVSISRHLSLRYRLLIKVANERLRFINPLFFVQDSGGSIPPRSVKCPPLCVIVVCTINVTFSYFVAEMRFQDVSNYSLFSVISYSFHFLSQKYSPWISVFCVKRSFCTIQHKDGAIFIDPTPAIDVLITVFVNMFDRNKVRPFPDFSGSSSFFTVEHFYEYGS